MKSGLLLALALTLLPIAGCADGTPDASAPNFLLISVDTLRRDHLGCYGYARPTSPRIDELARRGTLFENAVSTSSWTLPAHTSMLTGLYPAFHALQDDGSTLSSDVDTLARMLQAAGYQTLAVVSHVYVSSEFGLDRGFDRFDDSLIRGGEANPIAEDVVDAVLQRFDSLSAKPYFAFVHFFDPHWDYDPPAPYDSAFTDTDYRGPIDGTLAAMMPYLRGDLPMPADDLAQAIALYDGEIAYVDAQIGRMLDALERSGRLDDTVVVLTSDHGEEFREHGRLGHGKSLFQELLAVPLIVSGHPAFPAGERREPLTSIVDIAPTYVELAGLPPADGLQGHSLSSSSAPSDRTVFAESIRFGNEMRAALQGPFKLLHARQGDHRLYFDLTTDPTEQRVLGQDPTGGELTSRIEAYAAEADRGWHLKLIALRHEVQRFRGSVRVEGRILNARHAYSGHLEGPNEAEFREFRLSPDGGVLTFDASLKVLMGEITFETSPPDAAVTLDVDVRAPSGRGGVFLGTGLPTIPGEPLRLTQADPRLRGLPPDYLRARPGCYVRVVPPRSAPGEQPTLSDEARRRLRALGYVQ